MARHAIHVSEVLDVTIQTMEGLQRHQAAIHESLFPKLKNYTEYAKDYTSFQLQSLKSLKLRSDSNLERLKNEITLVKESRTGSCYGHRSLQFQAFIMIARKDNAVMRSIAILTMVFLPATFVTVRTTLVSLLSVNSCSHRLSSARTSSITATVAGKFRRNYGCIGPLLFPQLL